MVKVCRICLSNDARLYPIDSNGLRSLYQQISPILRLEEHLENRMPQWMCAECGLRLMSYEKLRQKSLRTHRILCKLICDVSYITEEVVQNIDRESYNLQSNLSHAIFSEGNVIDLQEMDSTSYTIVKVEELPETDFDCKIEKTEESLTESFTHTTAKMERDEDVLEEYLSDVTVSDNALVPGNALFSENSSLADDPLLSDSEKDLAITSLKIRSAKDRFKIQKQTNKIMATLQKKTNRKVRPKIPKINKKNVKKEIEKNPDPYRFEDYFTVKHLSWEEQVAELNDKKKSRNYRESPLKCEVCYKGFVSEDTFARHKLVHSEKWGKYTCKLCKRRYSTTNGYYGHLRRHKYQFSCKSCSFKSSNKYLCVKHGLQHMGKAPSYVCPHCGMQFLHESSYKSHLRVKHVSKFVCEYCGYSFLNAWGVKMHKKLKHRLEIESQTVPADGPTCATCNIKFVSDDVYDTHQRVAHPAIVGGNLRNVDATGVKSLITCEICDVELWNRTSYRAHFRRHHPLETPKQVLPALRVKLKANKNLMCEHCGQVYENRVLLQQHISVHTGEKPYKCHDCGKQYIQKNNLKQHLLHIHHVDHPEKESFTCDICGRGFSHSGNCKRHMIVHTDHRPCRCNVCGKSFKSQAEVYSHTAHVHLKKPWPKKSQRKDK